MVLGERRKADTVELPTFFVFIVSNTIPFNTGCYFISPFTHMTIQEPISSWLLQYLLLVLILDHGVE